MKVSLLVPLISTLCAALTLKGDSNALSSNAIKIRDNTPPAAPPADNPDNEPDYKPDPKSSTTAPRSKILPYGTNGVDTDEAKDRIFDWDSTY